MGLILENVSKTFAGKKVVDSISLKLDKPGVFGLLGTNGAGKTTTIRMILGILNKDTGNITWNGNKVERKSVNFGYLPEERGVYPKTKIFDQLMYFAELKGMNKNEAEKSISRWAKELKVEEYLNMPAEKLSKGNQQKIQFMTAIIHNPELVVLDEPFSGLDPVNTEIIKNIIIDLVKEGKYVIMSAHQMHTIEEFCSDILILNKGKTVLQGNLKDIKNTYPANRVIVEGGQIYGTELPIDIEAKNKGIIKPDLQFLESIQKANDELATMGINTSGSTTLSQEDIQKINQVYQKYKLPVKYQANGELTARYARFAMVNGTAMDKAFRDGQEIGSGAIEATDNEREQFQTNIRQATNDSKFTLEDDSFWSFGGDKVYKGTIFIPIRNNIFGALAGTDSKLSLAAMREVDLKQQQTDFRMKSGYKSPGAWTNN